MELGFHQLDTLIDGVNEAKIIALESGNFVGHVALLYRNRRSAGFCQLFVQSDRRKLGIGRELLKYCEDLSRRWGCETLGGLVAADNVEALAFYEKLGFIFAYRYEEDGSQLIIKLLK